MLWWRKCESPQRALVKPIGHLERLTRADLMVVEGDLLHVERHRREEGARVLTLGRTRQIEQLIDVQLQHPIVSSRPQITQHAAHHEALARLHVVRVREHADLHLIGRPL